jgi:hypothetical protein
MPPPIGSLPKSIATVSLSGTVARKMEAAAAIGFDGVETFENDLLSFRHPGRWPMAEASPTAWAWRTRHRSGADGAGEADPSPTSRPGPVQLPQPQDFVPADHPLRAICPLVNDTLNRLSPEFSKLYARHGRASSVPRYCRSAAGQTSVAPTAEVSDRCAAYRRAIWHV